MTMSEDEFVTRLLLMGFTLQPTKPHPQARYQRPRRDSYRIYDVMIHPMMSRTPVDAAPGESNCLRYCDYTVLLDSAYSEFRIGWYYRVPKNDPDPFQRAFDIIMQQENNHD